LKYFIRRQLNDYGPYTLAELQRCVAQGSVILTDLARSEGMADWVPVSQVIPSFPVAPLAASAPVPAQVYPSVATSAPVAGAVYSAPPVYQVAVPHNVVPGPMPPDLNWVIVLVISLFCGIFHLVWLFIQIAFIKKIKPENNSLLFILLGIGAQVAAFVFIFAIAINGGIDSAGSTIFFWLLLLGGSALQILGHFQMRDALVDYYNTVEPINLRLSGVMTFFFPVFYFQYHFCRISMWKKTGYLQPQ
jgi:hypothetical protein